MIILVGASATGKTEVGKVLSEKFNIKKVVTYTTRPMRIHEVDGIDYNFITEEEFKRLTENNFFFETMNYNSFNYGTSYESLKENAYVILDPTGLKKYINSEVEAKSFYLFCDPLVRAKRMTSRGDSTSNVRQRLEVDAKVFTEELKTLVDHVIEVDELSIEEVAEMVFTLSNQ